VKLRDDFRRYRKRRREWRENADAAEKAYIVGYFDGARAAAEKARRERAK
jgi:hypothetical protein